MPPLTPEAQQRQAATREARQGRGPADSYTDRSLYDRCISRGIAGSILPVIYNNGNEIVQAPGLVAIRNEMIHETRIVPLDGRPHPSPHITMWMGDSRGHWEGNTLVVETKNIGSFAPGIGVNGGGTRHSSDITITERFTRVSADVMLYEMHVRRSQDLDQAVDDAVPVEARRQLRVLSSTRATKGTTRCSTS